MQFSRVYDVMVDVKTNPILFLTDKHENLMNLLNSEYKGKNFRGTNIISIDEIVQDDPCKIISSFIPSVYSITVKFRATVKLHNQWEIIPMLVFKEEHEMMISYSNNTTITLLSRDAGIVKPGQRVCVRIYEVVAKPMEEFITIVGMLLTCEPGYMQYKITDTKYDASEIGKLISELKKSHEQRAKLDRERLDFFENLLSSVKAPITWPCLGPEAKSGYLDISNAIQAIKVGTVISRPLQICRSSSLVSLTDAAGAPTTEQSLGPTLKLLITNMLDYSRAVNAMTAEYTEKEIKDNANIWTYMRSKKPM